MAKSARLSIDQVLFLLGAIALTLLLVRPCFFGAYTTAIYWYIAAVGIYSCVRSIIRKSALWAVVWLVVAILFIPVIHLLGRMPAPFPMAMRIATAVLLFVMAFTGRGR